MATLTDSRTSNTPDSADTAKSAGSGGKKTGPRKRRARGGKTVEEGNFLYALAFDDGSNDGNLRLHKPLPVDKEVLRAAYKSGVNYYRLQKFEAVEVDLPEGGMQIVGKPVEG